MHRRLSRSPTAPPPTLSSLPTAADNGPPGWPAGSTPGSSAPPLHTPPPPHPHVPLPALRTVHGYRHPADRLLASGSTPQTVAAVHSRPTTATPPAAAPAAAPPPA